jgi:hypothetical protein
MNENQNLNEDRIERTGSTSRRRGLTVGLAGGLLAGTAAGFVFGIPGLSSAASQATPAVVVQQTDDTTDEPATPAPADAPERGERLREALQPLVDDDTITAEQADAVTATLLESLPARGEGPGHGGPGGRHGRGGLFGAGVASEALTDLLQIDAQELRTQLRDGATLADIAEAQGVAVEDVVAVLVAEVTERIDNAVEAGRIDQAEADEKLADVTERIEDMVENGRPDRGPGPDDQSAD